MFPDVFKLVNDAAVLQQRLNGLSLIDIAEDLRDLHQLMQEVRRLYTTPEEFVQAVKRADSGG